MNTAAAGTFPWTVEELELDLTETREQWKTYRHHGWKTDAIEVRGYRLAGEIAAAKANGGYILL